MTTEAPGKPASPYKGLTHYTEEDTGFFFGRESERGVIIANLMASRLTLVYGASGVGKSSLMRAGVARQLRDMTKKDLEEFGAAQFLPVVFNAWKDDPIGELVNCALAAAEDLLDRRPEVPEGRLDEQLAAIAEELDTTLLVILDQFEEYFLYHPHDEGPGSFAGDFPRAVNRRDLRVNFAISIREDALAMLDRFKGRIPNLFENYLRIDHLKRESARDAIEKPIEELNRLRPGEPPIEIEPELVEAVLDQIRTGAVVLGQAGEGAVAGGRRSGNGGAPAEDRIETPYLQLVMSRLWNEELGEGSRTLRLETLDRLGGAQKIVRTHLDEAMAELEPDEQDAAATIFRQLVTPSGTKIAHTVPDLADYARLPADELTPMLERLSGGDVRILRPVAPPPGQLDGGRYEIFHDVLAPAILDWRARYTEAKAREEAERAAEEAREEARQEKRRARIFRAVAIVAVIGGVVAAVLGIIAWRAKQTARSNSEVARATAALSENPARALDYSLAAFKSRKTAAAEDVLRRAVSETRLRTVVHAHHAGVNDGALSSDGRYFATASDDKSVRLWQVDGWKKIRTFSAHSKPVEGIAFSPDDRFIASASDDETIVVHEVGSGRKLTTLHVPSSASGAAFSPDGKFLLTVSDDALRNWDWRANRVVWSDDSGVTSAEFGPAGTNIVAVGDSDGTVRILDAKSGGTQSKERNQVDAINSVVFDRDGKSVLAASSDGSILVWPFPGSSAYYLAGTGGLPFDARFSPDGNIVAAAFDDGTIRLYDWRLQKLFGELRGHTDAATSVSFLPNAATLLSTSDDETVREWDVDYGTRLSKGDTVIPTAFTPDGGHVAVGTYGSAWVATPEGKTTADLTLPVPGFVVALAFQPHGDKLAVGAEDAVYLWPWESGGKPEKLAVPDATFNAIAFSGDGKKVAAAGDDGRVWIWDAGSSKLEHEFKAHNASVNALAFSPDGKLLATAGDDRVINLWNADTAKDAGFLEGHRGGINGLAFSPDGTLLASSSSDTTTRIWDVADRKAVHVLRQPGTVNSVGFDSAGKEVVTAGSDLITRVWSVDTGRLLADMREHADKIESVSFSPKGHTILSGSDDTTARIYPCITCGSLHDVRERAKRLAESLRPKELAG